MRIGILGTRGIPACYSGFETSVQETSIRFVKKNINTTVFCRSNHYSVKQNKFEGVELIYLPSIKSKHFDTVINTFLSVVVAIFKRFDSVIMYGVGNSFYIPVLKMFSIHTISIVDGADWERKKWGRFARWFLKMNRYFAVRFADNYVVDNEKLCSEYLNKFRKMPVYIPYGANELKVYNPNILLQYGLEEKKYIIFIGRFVKEKGIDFLIRNFEKIETDIKLVLIGDNQTEMEYVDKLKSTQDKRIIFTGFLYGENYESLLSKALFYVSTSFLEGTSPSLLSAMAINGFALVSDIEENKEVIKNSCLTFRVGDDLDFQKQIKYLLDNPESIEAERIKTKLIVNEYYNWDKIAQKYIDLFPSKN